ncbi:MAG TPA: alanine racemase, partial [Nitrospiraceae bacterium]|nr:alanine racemase [Nitrospiraceae bacterium]
MELSRVILNVLEREYGDSFYIVDLDAFMANYHRFLRAFRSLYPNTNIAYSYKTNYTPRLCQMVKEWGGYAEVVSRMEYDLARRLGVKPERIIFNGPYKSRDDMELALKLGSTVNLDSPYQVEIVDELARSFRNRQLVVGIRVTFDMPSSRPSRFGFNADSHELANILARLRRLANVQIAGLHCHFLTPRRSTEEYGFMTGRMLKLTAKHFGDAIPRFVNLGGGYFSKMKETLQSQFGIAVPTYQQYASAIATQLAAHYSNGDAPELILEPGICLTADVVKFAAKVIDVHEVGSRQLGLVSGSIYDI